MQTLIWVLVGAFIALGLIWTIRRFASFMAQRPADYDSTLPRIDIRQHLSGPILCEGVIYGPLGRVSSRFVADFEGVWDGSRGTLREEFTYDGGSTQSRQWQLDLGPDGEIRASAPDLIGTGQGWQRGSTVLLRYKIRLPESSGGHVLSVTDWMYLTANGTIMNRSQFRKFGIKVAELVATMRPAVPEAAVPDSENANRDVA